MAGAGTAAGRGMIPAEVTIANSIAIVLYLHPRRRVIERVTAGALKC